MRGYVDIGNTEHCRIALLYVSVPCGADILQVQAIRVPLIFASRFSIAVELMISALSPEQMERMEDQSSPLLLGWHRSRDG